jgi:hypothetical protein
MNNKQHDCNRDAGVGDIKSGPGMRIWKVQIEKKKIDHMSVKKAISKISQDSGKKKRQRQVTPPIRSLRPQQETQNNHKRDARNDDEQGIVPPEGSKRGASIGHVNQTEKI